MWIHDYYPVFSVLPNLNLTKSMNWQEPFSTQKYVAKGLNWYTYQYFCAENERWTCGFMIIITLFLVSYQNFTLAKQMNWQETFSTQKYVPKGLNWYTN